MDEISQEILSHRAKICNAFLVTYAILIVPAVAPSLMRIRDIGWQHVMYVHVISALTLWVLVIFRRKVSYYYQAGYLIMMFLLIGVGGILQFGLAAGGSALLVVSGPMATLLFGARVGFSVLTFSLGFLVVVGYLTVTGTLVPRIDLSSYYLIPTTWLTTFVAWSFSGIGMALSLHVFNKSMTNALAASKESQENLRKQQIILEEVIAEKEAAIREIRQLQGIIPICSYCHNIRSEEGAWDQLESYISKHSDAKFTHGVCPDCFEKVSSET